MKQVKSWAPYCGYGALCFGALVFFMHRGPHVLGLLGGILAAQLILACPFGLRTSRGRRWWTCYVAWVGCGYGAIALGPHARVAWLLAAAASLAGTVGVRVRWQEPMPGSPGSRPTPPEGASLTP